MCGMGGALLHSTRYSTLLVSYGFCATFPACMHVPDSIVCRWLALRGACWGYSSARNGDVRTVRRRQPGS